MGGLSGVVILFLVERAGILLLFSVQSLKFGEHVLRFVDFPEPGIDTAELGSLIFFFITSHNIPRFRRGG